MSAKLQVFVACPYTLFPLDDYKAVFSTVKKSYPVEFRFADEQITSEFILKKIAGYIHSADISLFDITGWNPNVSLELGIAVGLEKRYFILMNHKIDQNNEVPSDIRGIDRIQYGSNSELESKLMLLLKQEVRPEKVKSDSAFQELKEDILERLLDQPGMSIRDIANAVDEELTLIQSIVRAMVSNGEIKTSGQRRGTKYYHAKTDLRTVKKKRKK